MAQPVTGMAPTTLMDSVVGVSNDPDGTADVPAAICFMRMVTTCGAAAAVLLTVTVASRLPEAGSDASLMLTVKAPLPVPAEVETCSQGWLTATVQLIAAPLSWVMTRVCAGVL